MRSLATLISFLTLGCFISLAQTGQQQKAQNKDADKKQAVAAAAASKKDKAKNEKKEEPKNDRDDEKKPGINADTFAGLKFRLIGPAVASGRVMSIAVNPKNKFEYYVGVASGAVWKTANDGTTWTPLFDDQASYSIGWVELDPNDSSVVWSDRARAIRSAASAMVMAFTGPMMAARTGRIWA